MLVLLRFRFGCDSDIDGKKSGGEFENILSSLTGFRTKFSYCSANMSGSRRSRRNRGDKSLSNPVIVPPSPSGACPRVDDEATAEERSYELYYDHSEGSGLQPLPPTMSEFLMGSGFDRLLYQLVQIEVNSFGRSKNPPALKSAIDQCR
ncbi:hypothetical protein RND71_012255 [Anisodus tanguticus]|uniref:Uncharacterized protein n=1 Tax=Anisodus tanguticus TaxID=243964 RepID=A0AAE1SFI3_9SOLA|nr:hypothetical protein RND71_012255 [Anisodus tanguticus]